jgi:hypothetical protein
MSLLVTILIAVLIFSLLWYLISILPLPAPLANFKWVLYVILIILAVVWLLGKIGIVL